MNNVLELIGNTIQGKHAIDDAISMCDIMLEVTDYNERILTLTEL